jgi:hypothetical protein
LSRISLDYSAKVTYYIDIGSTKNKVEDTTMKPMYNTVTATTQEIAECFAMSKGHVTGCTQKGGYRLSPSPEGIDLTFIGRAKNINVRAVTIPLGTFANVDEVLQSYPEICDALTWVPQA